MPGINQTINVSTEFFEQIGNSTDITDFMIAINWDVYDGWLYFILLCTLWVLMMIVFLKNETDYSGGQILNITLYATGIVAVLSVILRAIYMTRAGIVQGLLTDTQMWVFPILAIILGLIIYATKKGE